MNDLTDQCDHIHPDAHPTLFADDLKIFSDQLQTSASSASGSLCSSSSLFQSTLNSIVTWSSTWQMTIYIPKCSVLSISNSKTCVPRLYHISNTSLPQVTTFNDLGILIDDKLTFSAHIRSSTKKAYSKSILLSRCFLSKKPYATYRCLHILRRTSGLFCNTHLPFWSPYLIKCIDAIEKVQRRFTKSFPNLRDLPYPTRLYIIYSSQ